MKKTINACRFLIPILCCLLLQQAPPALCASAALLDELAAPGAYRYDVASDNSTITYFLKGNVHDTLGTVQKLTGTASGVITREGYLASPAVQLSFKADDMNSQDERRDKRMKTKFLETATYPEIAFKSAAAEGQVPGELAAGRATREQPLRCDLTGELTIHGITRPISLPIAVYCKQGRVVAEGTTTLRLPDYAIKNPSFLVFRTADEVKIDFHIELARTGFAPSAAR
jgi:polyisoprenoid-binding protein YceI